MGNLDKKQTSDLFDKFAGEYEESVNSSIAFSGLKVGMFTQRKALEIKELLSDVANILLTR